MGEKFLDRAFNRVLAKQRQAEENAAAQRPKTEEELEAEQLQRLRKSDAPMAATDAIQRMLLAEKDKDYFRLLELPAPCVDALGRPSWPCSGSEIAKAYRRLSALVHPDKNPSPDARQAFEALNRAHRLLRDPGKLEEVLSSHLEAARRRRDAAEAAATPDERAIMFAAKREEAQQLRRNEAEKYKEELLQQRRRLQDRAKRKRDVEERAQRREAEDSGSDQDADANAAKTETSTLPAIRRKGKPKLIF